MIIGEWNLTQNEVENIETTTLTADEAAELIGSEGMTNAFDTALDTARGELVMGNVKRSFVLIKIEG